MKLPLHRCNRSVAFAILCCSAQLWSRSLAFTTIPSPASSPPLPSRRALCSTDRARLAPISRIRLAAMADDESEAQNNGNDSNDNDENNNENSNNDDPFENVAAAVIVPGFLTGADEFAPLCKALTERGIPTVAVPMPNWHWLPCLGGRSARPILERIDFCVKHLVHNANEHRWDGNGNANDNDTAETVQKLLNIPRYSYSVWDCWVDFRTNPGGVSKVGGSSDVDEYPVVEPRGSFPTPESFEEGNEDKRPRKKIALIGHSAGGWISRVYLSSSNYGGKSYAGSRYVHSLVTLGAPHSSAPGPAFAGISWINRPENERDRLRQANGDGSDGVGGVKTLAVAGTGFRGGEWGSLTRGAYSFCCPDGTDGTRYEGDGVTPVFSALDVPDSEKLVLEGQKTHHFCWSDVPGGNWVAPELTEDHRNGRAWYGSEGILEKWAGFIRDNSSNNNNSNNNNNNNGLVGSQTTGTETDAN